MHIALAVCHEHIQSYIKHMCKVANLFGPKIMCMIEVRSSGPRPSDVLVVIIVVKAS